MNSRFREQQLKRREERMRGYDPRNGGARTAPLKSTSEPRMAGDEIDKLIKSLEGDVALEKALADAEAYLPLRAQELAQLGVLPKKGKSLAEAEAVLDGMQLGELPGHVPMPIMKATPYGERRIHTNYSVNDITGQEQIVPYLDPTDPTKVLKTLYGEMQSGQQGDYDFASEYVGNQALKLAGMKSVANNQEVSHRADLRDTSVPMGQGNIDVERGISFEDKHTLPLQLTAALKTVNGDGEAAVARFMRENPNVKNLVDAMHGIRNAPYVRNNADKFFYGKGFKSINNTPEDIINKVLNLEYKGTLRNDKNFDGRVGVATAPRDINMMNPAVGMQILEDIGRQMKSNPSKRDLRIHSVDYQTGAGGRVDPRSKVKVNIPKGMKSSTGEVYSTNMLETNPLTQQLLDSSVLRERML